MANRMDPAPQWWPELVAFLAARRHVSGAVALLRTTGRLLVDAPRLTPAQLLTRTSRVDANTARVLATFFVHHGLALPGDEQHHRALDRQARLLGGVPPELADAVRCFHQTVRQQQDSARRGGRRPLTDTTLEGRLTILRDLARWLVAQRIVTGWAQIATVDLERFLAEAPQARHQRTYVLRGFFRWTKKHNITLVDPAKPLTLGRQPAFSSPLLDLARQRALFRRWTEPGTHPHERLTGLLALLHAASNQQIRGLRVNDVDPARRRITLAGRTFATPLDPATWDALSATLQHREQGKTLNPHVIVTGATGTGDRAASSSYLSRLLAQAGTTPSCARQSRISQLVTDLDPKLVAAALGMRDSGLVRYLADNVDQDRLDRHIRS